MSQNDLSTQPIHGLDAAPEIPVEGFHGAVLRNGVVKINCFTHRYDPIREANFKAASAILAFPLQDLIEFNRVLVETIEQLKAQGALHAPAAASDTRKAASAAAGSVDDAVLGDIRIEADPAIR